MELALTGESQAWPQTAAVQWHVAHFLHAGQTCAMRRGQFAIQKLHVFARVQKQITVQPLKIAVDILAFDDGLDPVDGRRVACATIRAPSSPCTRSIS